MAPYLGRESRHTCPLEQGEYARYGGGLTPVGGGLLLEDIDCQARVQVQLIK
jgi:hypothetical protein